MYNTDIHRNHRIPYFEDKLFAETDARQIFLSLLMDFGFVRIKFLSIYLSRTRIFHPLMYQSIFQLPIHSLRHSICLSFTPVPNWTATISEKSNLSGC